MKAKRLLSALMLACPLLCATTLHAQEPYAVLSDNNTVLTFYYDTQKAERNGMSVGPFQRAEERGWYNQRSKITTIAFDTSFANCTSLTSTSFWFDYCSNLTTITGIENLKTDNVTDMSCMFNGCSKLPGLDVSGFRTYNVTDMKIMFQNCSKLKSLDVSSFKTGNVTDMSQMFYSCTSLTSLDLSGFETNNVMNMASMFGYCSSLTSLDVSSFNTDNVTSMSSMFYNCSELTSLDVSGFKTDNVTNMGCMFNGCSKLTTLDVSGFKTDKVMYMYEMFDGCSGLTSLDVSGFKTDKVMYMYEMFDGCSGLTSLDVSGFKTDNVTNMQGMFSWCSGLTSLDLSYFCTISVTSMQRMFLGCGNLQKITVSNGWLTQQVTNSNSMFAGCSKIVGGQGTTYDIAHTDVAYARIDGGTEAPGYMTLSGTKHVFAYGKLNDDGTKITYCYDDNIGDNCVSLGTAPEGFSSSVTTIEFDKSLASYNSLTRAESWFKGFYNLSTIIGLENLNTENVTDMNRMFYGCSSLTSLDVSGFNTDKVTDMSGMFYGCSGLKSLDVSGFKTGKVTKMREMFYDCSGLTSLDVSGFKTDKVTEMISMFYRCSGLTSLDVSGFKTDNVTNMASMFSGCSGLTSLDVSGFKTDKVTYMISLFGGCSGLTSLDVSGFKTDNVTSMDGMFGSCSKLTTLDLSSFKTDNVTKMNGMFYGCSSLTTIYAGDGWSTDKVTNGSLMFSGCSKLVGGQGTKYESTHTDHTYARIDGGDDAPGYFTYKEVVSVKAGDVNGDGAVDVADIATVISVMSSEVTAPASVRAADVNGDGAVDVADIASVISEMAKSDDQEDPDTNQDDPNKGAMTAVDLGLSVKWAADDYGIDSPVSLKVDGGWRLPTQKECQELIDNCPSVWTYKDGVPGRKFTAANGNSIFLSANYSWERTTGFKFDPIVSSPEGRYWTSDHSDNPYFDDFYYWMYIGEKTFDVVTTCTSYLDTTCTVRLVHK